jgi:hypothetical protein
MEVRAMGDLVAGLSYEAFLLERNLRIEMFSRIPGEGNRC